MSLEAQLKRLLEARDAVQYHPYKEVFKISAGLSLQNVEFRKQFGAVTAERDDLAKRLELSQDELSKAQEIGNPSTLKKLVDLEHQLNDVRDERAILYKHQATNAQKIVEMMDQQREFEAIKGALVSENSDLKSDRDNLAKKLNDAIDLIKEKDGVIQILRDELSTHQLELVQREVQLNDAVKRLNVLDIENADLIARVVAMKEAEAKQLNAINDKKSSFQKTASIMSYFSKLTSPHAPEAPPDIPDIEIKSNCSVPETALKNITTPHEQELHCLAIKPDGSLLATGGADRRVTLYSTSLSKRSILTGSTQAIMSVAFNNADLVMASSNDNAIKLWSISNDRLKMTLTGHTGKVLSARFCQDSSVVSGSHDRTIKIWDLNKGYCIQTIFTLSSCNDVCSLDLSGSLVASGHLDNNLRFWDTRTGNVVQEVTGLHFGQITGVEKSPDYRSVLTLSRDNSLKLVDVRTHGSDAGFKVGMNWTKATFSPDGVYVACGSADGQLRVWNTTSGKLVANVSSESKASICSTVWHPLGGNTLFTASDRDKLLTEWGSS